MTKKKISIIAEMAWSHQGNINIAKKIALASKKAGANLISIHITDMDSYMVPHYKSGKGRVSSTNESNNKTIFNYLNEINLSSSNWLEFSNFCKKIKLKIIVMANDLVSFNFTKKKIHPYGYVISPSNFLEYDFLRLVAKTNKKVFLRTGGATLSEIDNVIKIFKQNKNKKLIILYGYQNYPTLIKNMNLLRIVELKKKFQIPIGIADHISGDKIESLFIPLLALPLDIKYIEKHITHDRRKKYEDFESALNPKDFKKFVEFVNLSNDALGDKKINKINISEKKYRNVAYKKLVYNLNLNKDSIIKKQHIIAKRSDGFYTANQLSKVINKKLKFNVKENDEIFPNHFY